MEWTTSHSPMGFSLDHPVGWKMGPAPVAGVVVSSPDGEAMAIIQPVVGIQGIPDIDIIQRGQFHAATLFPAAKPSDVTKMEGGSGGVLAYRTPGGVLGHATVMFTRHNDNMGMLFAGAAPFAQFGELGPVLLRILDSMKTTPASAQAPRPAAAPPAQVAPPRPAAPPAAAPLPLVMYTKFTEPQAGTFRMDVPVGWRIVGGFNHPQAGDRRCWWEVNSPEGIYIVCDPSFAQAFCHIPGNADGQLLQLAGGVMLNLKPSAAALGDLYLKQIGAKRYKLAQPAHRRPRPDIVALLQASLRRAGTSPNSFKIESVESIFPFTNGGKMFVVSMVASSVFNGQYAMGSWAFWDGVVHTMIAPQELIQRGDEVRARMIGTWETTAQLMQIYQRDEQIIAANGAAANANQWNWFGAQQAGHRAQMAQGDAIMNNYWQTQASNDRMLRGWEHNQAVNAQASQNWSDAMLGNQRLLDEAGGKEYQVAAGSNYYWKNPQTDEVIGTETSTPPDYNTNYTLLKKL